MTVAEAPPRPRLNDLANPALDDGWFKLAYELLPVLLLGGFRVEASIVLCEVLAQTYGRGKLATARLDPAKIAARSGRKRPNIWRGIRELTAANVIERLDDGTYKFHKDYAVWRSGEEPLIDTTLTAYCASYPLLAKSYERCAAPNLTVSQADTPSEESDGSSVSQADTQTVSTVDTRTVSQDDTRGGPPLTLPPDSAGDLEIGRVSLNGTEQASERIVSTDEKLPRKWEGIPEADLAELRHARTFALEELSDRGGAAIARYMEQYPRPVPGMPLWWWMEAFMCYSLRDTPMARPAAYVAGILKGFLDQPPTRSTAPPANGEAPAPPRPRKPNSGERFVAGVPAMLAKLDAEGFDWTTGKTREK
jgi:hypothetical protein